MWSGSGAEDPETKNVVIAVEDEDARSQFLQISITKEAFTRMTLGHQEVEAQLELYNLENLGTIAQNKVELIPMPGEGKYFSIDRPKEVTKALKPYEVDGWSARVEDLHNHHNYVARDKKNPKGPYQKVAFFRQVKREEQE